MTQIRTRTASFSFNTHAGDEEVICRVCGQSDGDMMTPCKCEGADKFVHVKCLYTLMLQRNPTQDWWKLSCPKCKQPYEGADEEILHKCEIEMGGAPLSDDMPPEEMTMMKMIELTNIPKDNLKSQKYRGLRDAMASMRPFELNDYLKEELDDFNLEKEEKVAEDEMPQLSANDNLMMAMTSMALGHHFKVEDYDRGCELLESVLELRDTLYGEDVQTLKILSQLSRGYENAKNFEAQMEVLERELALKIQLFGESHHLVLQTMTKLADVYGLVGEYEDQWEMLERAKPIIKIFSIKLELAQVRINNRQNELRKKRFRKVQSTQSFPKRNGGGSNMVRSFTDPRELLPIPGH